MLRFILCTLLLIFPAAAITTSAVAGSEKSIVLGSWFKTKGRFCDTVDQVRAIAKANVESGFMAGENEFLRLQNIKNSDNEPVCGRVPLLWVVAVETFDKYNIRLHNGDTIEGTLTKVIVFPVGKELYTLFFVPVLTPEEVQADEGIHA